MIALCDGEDSKFSDFILEVDDILSEFVEPLIDLASSGVRVSSGPEKREEVT
jgi:hypothetical protein